MEFLKETKTVMTIQDISGFGKCSATVALPILSVANIETTLLPTAVLSNHTAFDEFTYTDLTGDMLKSAEIWEKEGATFDALYTGFLGSIHQINIVKNIFEKFKTENTLIIVDPVMGDNGKLYSTYTNAMAKGMTELCQNADVIIPNMTEATFMAGETYEKGPYTKEYIEKIIDKLKYLNSKYIVITGIYFDDQKLGSVCFSKETGEIHYSLAQKFLGMFHGTGDIFASVLTACILRGKPMEFSVEVATHFVSNSIKNTIDAKSNPMFGVKFEPELLSFLNKLQ